MTRVCRVSTDGSDPLYRLVVERDGDLVTIADEEIDNPDPNALTVNVSGAVDLSIRLFDVRWLIDALRRAPIETRFEPFCMSLLSSDPDDPLYRFRLERGEDTVIELAQESITSRNEGAVRAEARASVLLSTDEALWLREAIEDFA